MVSLVSCAGSPFDSRCLVVVVTGGAIWVARRCRCYLGGPHVHFCNLYVSPRVWHLGLLVAVGDRVGSAIVANTRKRSMKV